MAAAPVITLIIAAAMGLLNLWLGLRVAQVRVAKKVMVGDGEVPQLLARGRAHANFNEYVPIALILMLLVELRVGASPWLWAAGAALVIGRVLHPFGMERPAPNPLRLSGILLTWATIAGLVLWAVLIAYGVAR
nr:MAPEG family protein [uncultured Sphingomonas sp.]